MNYQITKKPLHGNFPILEKSQRSTVRLFTDPATLIQSAMKFVKDSTESPQMEYNILQRFSHPNIITALNVGIHDKMNYLATEYMNQGDLLKFALNHQFLYAIRRDFSSEKFWRSIFQQSLQALRYLHVQGYAHLDVKPENFLINDEFDVKLSDFEFCFALDILNPDRRQCNKICGTRAYYPPEIKEKTTPYDPTKCDVFSFAVMMLCLITGINVLVPEIIYEQIKSGDFKKFWKYVKFSEFLSAEFKDLIEKMMTYDANQRISIEEVENHPWFKSNLLPKNELKGLLRTLEEELRMKSQREKDSKYESIQKKIKKNID